ncbi:MAG: ferrous iron transport protein A [Clostridia bacterium]|jgi:Fe2+ transport system protein FeoA|nr:ferrous iron transport protein A [Clostridia bacterium]
MNVSELKRGEHAIVIKVELPMLLKERLRSLGIYMGAKFVVLKTSFKKKVFLIQTGGCKVALDFELAEGIRVLKT